MESIDLICGCDATQIEALKQEHGFLVQITVSQGGEKHNVIFKEPSLKVMKAAQAVSKSDDLQASINMYNNCMVVQDASVEERDILKIRAVQSLIDHLNTGETTPKNL